jgi:hypothetical protein
VRISLFSLYTSSIGPQVSRGMSLKKGNPCSMDGYASTLLVQNFHITGPELSHYWSRTFLTLLVQKGRLFPKNVTHLNRTGNILSRFSMFPNNCASNHRVKMKWEPSMTRL